ncbi:MAG TPA: hypothetical protein VF702_14400 [Allosphingosinicella sp.]|jgi:hypothetical protein
MLVSLFLLQAAAQAQTPPDIELQVDASIRRVTIERRGEARLEVQGGEGSVVTVEAPEAGGRRNLRNVNVRVRAEARIAGPRGPSAQINSEAETRSPE